MSRNREGHLLKAFGNSRLALNPLPLYSRCGRSYIEGHGGCQYAAVSSFLFPTPPHSLKTSWIAVQIVIIRVTYTCVGNFPRIEESY